MRLSKRVDLVFTRENIEWAFHLLKPKTHNKLAWLTVITGTALLASPVWEPIIRSIVREVFGANIDPPNSPWFGVLVVFIGLGYHFAMNYLEAGEAGKDHRKSIQHDSSLAERFRSSITELQLERLLQRLDADHAHFRSERTAWDSSADLLGSAEMHFLDPNIREYAATYCATHKRLSIFLGRHFFVYPDRDMNDQQYALCPEWNWDRGAPSPQQEAQYRELESEMHDLVHAMRNAYRNLIKGFHEKLKC